GEAAVLVDEALGSVGERLRVLRGPPLLEIAARVELPSLIVEAVRQFVADDGAHAAVVDAGVALDAVERRLQDAGGEVDVVLERVVVRVDGRRRHAPFALVYRLADLVQLAAELERVRALRVAERIAAGDAQRAVVAPVVRVADLVGDGVELRRSEEHTSELQSLAY